LKLILRGHHDLIHDISWSQDDNYLVTASADGSAKAWDLTTKETDYADKLNYTENDAMFFISQMLHSSYVHAAKIFPEQSQLDGKLLVATACFDQKVRLWHVLTDQTGIGAHLSPILELSI
jgi:jouberin